MSRESWIKRPKCIIMINRMNDQIRSLNHRLKHMGNIDPDQLENFDPSSLSEEELEAQMRLFYKMVQAGQNPLDPSED